MPDPVVVVLASKKPEIEGKYEITFRWKGQTWCWHLTPVERTPGRWTCWIQGTGAAEAISGYRPLRSVPATERAAVETAKESILRSHQGADRTFLRRLR